MVRTCVWMAWRASTAVRRLAPSNRVLSGLKSLGRTHAVALAVCCSAAFGALALAVANAVTNSPLVAAVCVLSLWNSMKFGWAAITQAMAPRRGHGSAIRPHDASARGAA